MESDPIKKMESDPISRRFAPTENEKGAFRRPGETQVPVFLFLATVFFRGLGFLPT